MAHAVADENGDRRNQEGCVLDSRAALHR